jgi:hypothetical protein
MILDLFLKDNQFHNIQGYLDIINSKGKVIKIGLKDI